MSCFIVAAAQDFEVIIRMQINTYVKDDRMMKGCCLSCVQYYYYGFSAQRLPEGLTVLG